MKMDFLKNLKSGLAKYFRVELIRDWKVLALGIVLFESQHPHRTFRFAVTIRFLWFWGTIRFWNVDSTAFKA